MPDQYDSLMTLAQTLFHVKNPRTDKVIEFDLHRGQNKYLFFRPRGSDYMYCYTPHPDKDGWFYSWVYKPIGKGSRSGDARRWHLIKLMPHRVRRAAKARAIRLHDQYLVS